MRALQAAPGHIWIGEYSPALTPAHLERSRGKMSGYFSNAQAGGEKLAQLYICYLCVFKRRVCCEGRTPFIEPPRVEIRAGAAARGTFYPR